MQTDYIIVGQGICGSFMSYCLHRLGKKILVIDKGLPFSSSMAASGIINPVTGKRLATTWMADQLMPFAGKIYKELEQYLSLSLISSCDILDFHDRMEARNMFEDRIQEGNPYLHRLHNEDQWQSYFRYSYGMGQTAPVWLINIKALLEGWHHHLANTQSLLEEHFDVAQLRISHEGVVYQDIHAEKIIFCDGAAGFDNPWFSLLPYSRNKGEAMLVSIPGLPKNHIYKQDFKIVPWEGDLFWVGASFEWDFEHTRPTEAFREKVQQHLDYWLKLPYKIEEHFAAERPATVGHRPFVGLHPVHRSVGLLNGMGTKACSLAPWLAHQFSQHLVHGSAIIPDADINRFLKLLTRPGV